jgi:thiol-disulfide isomerase/thioredoxin
MSNDRLAEEAEERRRGRIKMAIWSTVIVIGIIAFIFLAKFVSNSGGTPTSSTSATGASPAPTSLVKSVTTLPTSLFNSVGGGGVTALPKAIQAPALTSSGKPEIVDMSSEYCPYCAAERWPTVIALSKFGTFKNLQVTQSGSADVYPSTQTFSFYGSSFQSQYIDFDSTELQTNVPSGTTYTNLQTPSQTDQALMTKYDAAPYLSASSAGSIPFIDFGGKYLISGASYSPSLLQGQSYSQIAQAIANSKTSISQGVIGAANLMTAAICEMTGGQPSNVCSSQTIQTLQSKLNAQ